MIPRIFIVDDEAPARSRLRTLLADIVADCPHELVGEADDAQAALDGIAKMKPDIVLLDVQMPGTTGIELAERLPRNADSPAVIFVTAYDQFALKAFEVQALGYLLKPVRASRLQEAIRRVTDLREQVVPAEGEQIATAPTRKHFSVQERDRVLMVPVADVLYLKAEQKYVTLRTAAREYLIEESLLSIEQELSLAFVRVHRNTLVARNAIIGVERAAASADAEGDGDKTQETWQVLLRGVEERLPISRRQWSIVKALVR